MSLNRTKKLVGASALSSIKDFTAVENKKGGSGRLFYFRNLYFGFPN
ncbi:MAG: hypothetical protein JWM78_1150 [Verrucomicrobiaceae bacterium]|nr:hypothetical protein [Verrucomicrobiaceae bacterium]